MALYLLGVLIGLPMKFFTTKLTEITNELLKEGYIKRLPVTELQQAKAMHKSEIIWAHGIKMKGVNNHKCVSGEQYYNETFGGNNEKL